MARGSVWRVSDATVYDGMRASAITLTHLLLTSPTDAATGPERRAEAVQLRADVLTVDGYDRSAVEALAAAINARIRELTGAAR